LYLIKNKKEKKSLRMRGTIGINCGALCLKAKKKRIKVCKKGRGKTTNYWYVLQWIIIVIPFGS
jgi:hypothetical protein